VTKLTAATIDPTIGEPSWRIAQRTAALEVFHERGLPDPESEVWRYAPLSSLHLEDLELSVPGEAVVSAPRGMRPAADVTIAAGMVIGAEDLSVPGVRISSGPEPEALGSLVGPDDAFAALNLALTPTALTVEIAPGTRVEGPIVVRVHCTQGASFPRIFVRLGDGASARILEHVTGANASLVAGVAEYLVGPQASLEVCTVQSLGPTAWSIVRTRASLDRAASFSQTVVGLGGRYDRVRADARLEGEGATSTLHTAHVGIDEQVHDLRTMQVHIGRKTTSRLFSKAAVADHAESIYSGLIAMRHGAKRADALQANESLVLADGARADAVPNLDIEESDVRCAHSSKVGPVDPEQRWYLESRGVAPHDAVRLIVQGFFKEVESLVDDEELGRELRAAIAKLEIAAIIHVPESGTTSDPK
jgi:Fe-S cluster assembly protein SufD